MANSRKFPCLNKSGSLQVAFERALGDILARVCVSAPDQACSIAVAYSGGLDSSVLLHLASQYAATHGLVLHAFHVHHGLSAHADQWLAHCEEQAQRYGVGFAARRVTLEASSDRGIEESARIARYAALGDLCRQHQVSILLTAHHQDDQAETILLQMMRGAGLPGMSAMAALQSQHELLGAGIALARPLLVMPRLLLERACDELALSHVDDESNVDTRYRRNAVRHQIFPAIEAHFPGFVPLITRTASHAQAAQGLLHELALIDLNICQADPAGKSLAVPALRNLSAQRVDNLLRHWLYRLGVQLPSAARLDEIRVQMLTAAQDTNPFFDFGPMRLHRVAERLELHRNLGVPPEDEIALTWKGEEKIAVPAWGGWLHFDRTGGLGLDVNRLRGTLTLRPRTGSERLKLALNRPSKGLKHLFQEAGIGARQREWLPLAYFGQELVFVAGLGMDVRHMTPNEAIVLRWEQS